MLTADQIRFVLPALLGLPLLAALVLRFTDGHGPGRPLSPSPPSTWP